MFLVARLAKSFSVLYFSYKTSRVCTLRTLRCVNRIAVRRAAKSQCAGFSTSTVPHLNFLVNTPLRSSGGPCVNACLRTTGLSGEMGVSSTGDEGPGVSSGLKLDSGEGGCACLIRGVMDCSGAISAKGSRVERSILETT